MRILKIKKCVKPGGGKTSMYSIYSIYIDGLRVDQGFGQITWFANSAIVYFFSKNGKAFVISQPYVSPQTGLDELGLRAMSLARCPRRAINAEGSGPFLMSAPGGGGGEKVKPLATKKAVG